MSMLNETLDALWADAKLYAVAILKTAAVTLIAYWGLRAAGLQIDTLRMGIAMALVFWGSVMMFCGPLWTGKDFWVGLQGSLTWVDTATPGAAWRVGGWVCWGLALLALWILD